MSKYDTATVQSVHHWTDTLFSFTCSREPSLRFNNGEFTMVGLEVDGKPLARAYSIVSPNYEDHLEFFSIKVQDGPLTSRLQHLKVGDTVLIGKKPTGTLVADNLLPGKTLWMLSTGTGLAPFMSIIRDPDIYERFDKVILTHTCRLKGELAYMDYIKHDLPGHEYLGRHHQGKARLLPDGHPRSVRQRRPDHRSDRDRQAVHRSRRGAVLAGTRPRDAVRQHRDAEGHHRPAEAGRPGRGQEQRARTLRDRARLRGLIGPRKLSAVNKPELWLRFFFVPTWRIRNKLRLFIPK